MDRADYIAGCKTSDDWKSLRAKLERSENKDIWETAYNEYFFERLEKRYFAPIKLLMDNSTYQGEGFTIVTICCSLIEFLETSIQGLNYKYLKNNQKLTEFEYCSSKAIFINFLSEREPFNKHFNKDSAKDFYENIRCGLLHEAQTKNGWRIHACSPNKKIISEKEKIVYRNNLQDAFAKFLDLYKKELLQNEGYQAAFIRKFDSLCNSSVLD